MCVFVCVHVVHGLAGEEVEVLIILYYFVY